MTSVASTISTGGGGTEFERRVGAYFLALLLTNSFCPIFSESSPRKVHFQARRLGWEIDDLVVEAANEAGEPHNICVQAKRTFTVSATDKECVATIEAAWKDFNNSAKFGAERDALVLVTYLGTNRIQFDLRWLLDQARARASAVDFAQCLSGEGLLNKKSKGDYETIKSIIDAHAGAPVEEERIWRFLRAFYVLSFDFLDSAGKDEASIKAILAALRSKDAPIDAAAITWAELIVLAGDAAPQGRSVDFSMLPADMRRRHDQVASSKHGELSRLRSHSSVVLRRVTDAGPSGVVFERLAYREKIECAFASNQIVLIVGPAGSGKSALGKRFLADAGQSETTFAFSSEEFKGAHIDGVLSNANVGLVWQEFLGLLPLHRKIFLVESLERLLEVNDRAAFNDLLFAAKDDPSISLVLTCRDYYAEIVERNLLVPSGVRFGRVAIGGLTDAELDQASAAAPHLKPLIEKAALRPLLRNPFLLAKANELDWNAAEPVPATERDLRKRLWSEVIRRDGFTAAGMPGKRERLFFRICVDRARALVPFVALTDDEGARDALANDNLLAFNEARNRVAVAHDVLEDWGLAEWLARQFDEHDGSVQGMLEAVGEHPALRRAYRKWLAEQLDEDSDSLLDYVKGVSGDSGIPKHFRDDTLLAIFQSDAAGTFLANFKSQLLGGNCALLLRVMDLVRVGCKTVDPRAKGLDVAAQWNVPAGKAWQILLGFIVAHWDEVPRSADAQIADFIAEWADGVSIDHPYPLGAKWAGWLIGKLLGRAEEGWSAREPRKQLIELLVKVPKANSDLFKDLCKRAGGKLDDEDASLLVSTILAPYKSVAACRDFPAEIVTLCSEVLLSDCEDDEEVNRLSIDVDHVFGLRGDYEHRLIPPSALQGPFFWLLRFNPRIGIPFIIDLVNKACSRYAALAPQLDIIEGPVEVELVLADGASRKVIANDRLWKAYRAASVVPSLIECALMALEKWFLEVIEVGADEEIVQRWLDLILQHSNNAATLAVVASICICHPRKVGAAGVSILGCREFFQLDIARRVSDRAPLAVGGMDAYAQQFQKERIESNKLPHRAKHLENLALDLQLGAYRDAVCCVLDRFASALAPEAARSRKETEWKLALQRMDLRTYEAKPVEGGVEFHMGKLPADVVQLVEEVAPQQDRFNRAVRLKSWGLQLLKGPEVREAPDWEEHLALAQEIDADLSAYEEFLAGAVPIAAAVLVRDFWDMMHPGDQAWCLATVEKCIRKFHGGKGDGLYHGTFTVDGSSECASLIGNLVPRLDGPRAEALLLVVATHFNDHVRASALVGIDHLYASGHLGLFNYAVRAIIESAQTKASLVAEAMALPYSQRPSFSEVTARSWALLDAMQKDAWSHSLPTLDETLLSRADALVLDLAILCRRIPDLPLSRQLFDWIAGQFATWWEPPKGHRRNIDLDHKCRDALAEFIVRSEVAATKPLVAHLLPLVDTKPREIAQFFSDMISAADKLRLQGAFWSCWSDVSERVLKTKWVEYLTDRSSGEDLIQKLFLNTLWKPEIREWSCLGERYRDVDELFKSLPAVPVALESYLHYLIHVGRPSMPQALIHIHERFGDGIAQTLKSSSHAKGWLNQVVTRAVFESFPTLQKAPLREAVLAILDALVEAGSSNAFLLREDFVTPTGAAAG